MSNPFLDFQQYESKPPRNSFDLSKRCYMTGKLGGLYPCLLVEVNSGDSIQVDSSMLFNFFPFVFPVQTPLRASVYYFYGRNRNAWDNWQDFAYNNKQPDHPFILQPSGAFWKTGSLADYLGVPTTYSSLGESETYGVLAVPPFSKQKKRVFFGTTNAFFDDGGTVSYTPSQLRLWPISDAMIDNPVDSGLYQFAYEVPITSDNWNVPFEINNFEIPQNQGEVRYILWRLNSSVPSFPPYDEFTQYFPYAVSLRADGVTNKPLSGLNYSVDGVSSALIETILRDFFSDHPNEQLFLSVIMTAAFASDYFGAQYSGAEFSVDDIMGSVVVTRGLAVSRDLSTLQRNPFSGTVSEPPAIPLNAIPFRLYEAIYNCYFRNERNDPFMIDDVPEYNKYNTTLADGADSTPYHIYFRNWEADFLTTATQTPQQGIAPLVGINVRGDMEFMNEDGTITKIRPTIDDDGHTITGIAGVVENGTPEALRSAMDYITAGISINDFRQVNSLQRWLEDNLRRGLKYRDQVMASTGVKIRYDELDLPEFIGGYSRPVQMTAITQATPATADDNALGDRAGQASVFGGSKHKIQHYCDEAGFIMGIVCITPQPVYTQLLPKYFLKSDALSYYHPQFGTIGMQPISYREVCPVQVFQENGNLNDVFGYQRPWYDLIGSYDEAHGLMRTNMRDFLMHRTFAGIPKLGAEFLHVDPEQLNDVFAYTDGSQDVFQGQIYHEVYVKRAIPRFGIPRIN